MTDRSDADVLEGLADVPWADLEACFGRASTFPDVLRAVADGDEEAVWELCGQVYHQGTVYPASVAAVPFMARIAAAGTSPGTAHLVCTLGFIAQRDDQWDDDLRHQAQDAVAAQAGVFIPLLRADDPDVRMWTGWTLAQGRPAGLVVPAMRACWDDEQDPSVRALLLRAMSQIDPVQAAPLAEPVAADTTAHASERVVAAWACVAGGVPWTASLSNAATAWLGDGLDLRDGWWCGADPFQGLLLDLAGRGDLDAAADLAIVALTPARQNTRWAAEELVKSYPIPDPERAAVLARLILPPGEDS